MRDIFTLIVGKEKADFRVHFHMIGVQSNALHAMMNGQMSEAMDVRAELTDVSAATIERFCQYVYTGHYAIPAPLVSELIAGEVGS